MDGDAGKCPEEPEKCYRKRGFTFVGPRSAEQPKHSYESGLGMQSKEVAPFLLCHFQKCVVLQ